MWKIGGLVFTHSQLVQLFNHIRPERAEKPTNDVAVYQTVIALALKKNLDFIAVDIVEPNGGLGTRFILCIYSKPAAGTETTTNFEKWEEGRRVTKIRKWLTVRGVEEPLPFDTFMV
ncbi:hypothetical protein EV363DRAFT_1172431 [Boletus edulis]|nr:hypothetical protein EV363DRAFT_1172431 [Boletus edulis]